jgi:predicted RNA-binding protein Jag
MDAQELTNFVSELLAALGASFESVTVTLGHRTVVAVKTAESERLIGPHGEHLRALTLLARRIVEQKHGVEAASFLIDINGYQEAQLEGVRQQARMLAQRARLFKHEVEMPPMSSYERLVVHELFADDPEIKTESAGDGKFRHIVLKYSSGSPSIEQA